MNNFWRALANHPDLLAHTWSQVKSIMLDPAGSLDPLTRELIYIAVSTANNCSYCIHSHTAAARARGLPSMSALAIFALVEISTDGNGAPRYRPHSPENQTGICGQGEVKPVTKIRSAA